MRLGPYLTCANAWSKKAPTANTFSQHILGFWLRVHATRASPTSDAGMYELLGTLVFDYCRCTEMYCGASQVIVSLLWKVDGQEVPVRMSRVT
jgi:hypothetical protein